MLDIVNDNTTPIVIRTPWVYHPDAGAVLKDNKHDSIGRDLWLQQYPRLKEDGGNLDRIKKTNPATVKSLIQKIIAKRPKV